MSICHALQKSLNQQTQLQGWLASFMFDFHLLSCLRLAWAIAQLALSGLSFLLACYTACRKDPTAPVQLTAVVEFATEASPPPVSAAPVPAPSAEPPPEAAEASGADAPPPATAAAAAVAVAHGGTPMEPMWRRSLRCMRGVITNEQRQAFRAHWDELLLLGLSFLLFVLGLFVFFLQLGMHICFDTVPRFGLPPMHASW